MATAIHEGHTANATRLKKATTGDEQIAIVTPAKVRIRPCENIE